MILWISETEGEVSGHSYRATITEPTCTTDGYTTYRCKVCGYSYTDNLVTASGHSWVDATCTEAQYCTVCGEIGEDKLEHSYETVVTPPSYTQGGYTTHTCTNCGYSYMDEPVAALDYVAECTVYRTYCQIKVTAATSIMALPCNSDVAADVKRLDYAGKNQIFTCSYFYK